MTRISHAYVITACVLLWLITLQRLCVQNEVRSLLKGAHTYGSQASEHSQISEEVDYIYVGDSRVRHMFQAHAKHLSLTNVTQYSLPECQNNVFRYSHVSVCSDAEQALKVGENRLFYRACWRSNLSCFDLLTSNVSSLVGYLQLDASKESVVFAHIGLHDAIYSSRDVIDNVYLEGLRSLFELEAHIPFLNLIWIDVYPLFAPSPGTSPKFDRWRVINYNINRLVVKTHAIALTTCITTFSIVDLLACCTQHDGRELSPDGVHLAGFVDDMFVQPLLASIFHKSCDDSARNRKKNGL